MLFLLRRGGEGAKCKGGRKFKKKRKKKKEWADFHGKANGCNTNDNIVRRHGEASLSVCGLLTRCRRERVAGVTGSNIYIYPVGRGIDKHVTHLQFYGARGCSLVSEEEAVQWSFVGAGGRL